jgi:hypothetical protein
MVSLKIKVLEIPAFLMIFGGATLSHSLWFWGRWSELTVFQMFCSFPKNDYPRGSALETSVLKFLWNLQKHVFVRMVVFSDFIGSDRSHRQIPYAPCVSVSQSCPEPKMLLLGPNVHICDFSMTMGSDRSHRQIQ